MTTKVYEKLKTLTIKGLRKKADKMGEQKELFLAFIDVVEKEAYKKGYKEGVEDGINNSLKVSNKVNALVEFLEE